MIRVKGIEGFHHLLLPPRLERLVVSNAINVKKWYFTSLVPNVASMEIAPL
jgi:hypothetical protein